MLTKAIPGKPSKQAPRVPAALILALETFLMDSTNLPYMRLYACFMALQNWATLRFSDHRVILPESISWRPSGFAAVLSRSKTLGSDKNVLSRPLRVDTSCFVCESSWMKTSLQLLRDLAPFSRDYLVPAPEKKFSGCRRMELKYEIGYAVLNRVMSLLKSNQKNNFPVPVTSFWTPHSGRSFLPSCCAALDFSKEERDYLGSWSTQRSDRYARIARLRISNLQRAVARSTRQGPQGDSLGERESHLMQQKNVALVTLCAISSAISSWDPVPEISVRAALEVEFDPALSPIIEDEPSTPTAEPEAPVAKKRGGQAAQSSWEKILKRPGLASGRTFLKAFIFAYLASAQSVRSIVLAHVMHFLILTICVGPIPVRICPSLRSMMWYAHYAHVKGLSPQHCRGAQSLRPPHLRMRHKAHESLQTVHRHLTIMGKAHYNSPKTGFSLTFPCSFALANQGMSQFQGSQGAILELTPAGHICCGFSPFLHAAVAAQVCSCTLLQYSVLGFIMPFLAVSEEQKANAKPLEPAFEALLRTVDLDEELITNLRVRNVLDREIFSSFEMNEENFRETIASSQQTSQQPSNLPSKQPDQLPS